LGIVCIERIAKIAMSDNLCKSGKEGAPEPIPEGRYRSQDETTMFALHMKMGTTRLAVRID